MKKIFYFIASAIVALGAVACQNDIDENIAPESEGLSFTAEVEMTRIDIGTFEEGKGYPVVWENGDELDVTYTDENEVPHTFTFTFDGEKFVCEETGVNNLVGETVSVNYFASSYGIDSKAGKAGMFLASIPVTFENGMKIDLSVQNSFLRFSSTDDVTLTLSEDAYFVVDNAEVQSITLKGDDDVWVAFNYGMGASYTLSASIDDVIVKQTTTFAPQRGKIYNLGDIEKEESAWAIVGSFQGWDVAKGKAITMYKAANGEVFAKGIELYKVDEFKFVKNNVWDGSLGFGAVAVATVDVDNTLDGDQNVKAQKNGVYDFYLNPEAKTFKYECVEEYTDLMVDITIDNKANWSPLYITLKSGDTTIVNNATVTDNKYAISGDYIGEDLSYTLSNGSKSLEGSINISKTGATITLEETVIKLKITLNTDNSKQWWGNTMKIHAWGTGTSFDTSWPGNNMTFEGDYTWSVIVPSELVGKTITYLVHNGNGWQSNDSTVTIKAEGNTVNGSDIGIN